MNETTWTELLKAAVAADGGNWEVVTATADEFVVFTPDGSTLDLIFDGDEVVGRNGVSVQDGNPCELDWDFPAVPTAEAAAEFVKHYKDW